MAKVRVIEVHENVFNTNNLAANELRERLSKKKVTMLNVMSSPGSGKTTLLSDVINRIKDQYKIGVMDVDIETSLDAQKVADKTGVPSIQIHNGGLCHIDAEMTTKAIDEFGVDDFDLLFLENINNRINIVSIKNIITVYCVFQKKSSIIILIKLNKQIKIDIIIIKRITIFFFSTFIILLLLQFLYYVQNI